jgi:adenylate cyclase
MPMERRLAAILATDVVGYSRLIRADEEGTIAALKALRADLIDPKIAEHHGRIVKLMGDGMLAEFASVVDAVRAAAEVLQAVAERNADLPADKRIEFRVGINLGDVVIDGDDIQGDGVNIAARLEGLAEPGGMCISGGVYDQVRDRLDLPFVDTGEHALKNIDRPVRVWRWARDVSATMAGEPVDADAPLRLPDKPSIAVLAFENMSGDPEQEYFSDGITEDIITALSKVHWLFVIARNSTFTFKGSAVDVTRVARELGVRYVLEGSVRKAANKVRITAQLVDGTTGIHVWADRYDRELDDIFALQDEIAETIVGRIDTEVRASEIDRARRKPPANLDAWELYQRGLWHSYKVTKEDNEAARNLFYKAIERDPNFALAHAGIAFTCHMDVLQDFGDNPAERLAKGLAAGEHAVTLDDKDGFTHYVLGRVLALAGQGDRAIADLEKSVALNPSFAHGYHGLGFTLNWYGRAADAIPMLDMAMRLSPHDPFLWSMQGTRAHCCNNLENYDEAVEWARKAINTPADHIWPRLHLAVALVGQDQLDEARVAIESARRVKPDLSLSVMRRLLSHLHPEYLERWIDALRKAGLPE